MNNCVNWFEELTADPMIPLSIHLSLLLYTIIKYTHFYLLLKLAAGKCSYVTKHQTPSCICGGLHDTSLTYGRAVSHTLTDTLTDTIVKWTVGGL